MAFTTKDWKDANPDGTGDHSTPTDAPAFEDLERRVGGAAGANSLVAAGVPFVAGASSPDAEPLFQAALDAQRGNPVWLEGEAKTYVITKPLVLPPFAKLRQMTIKASSLFAPADANGAMVMLAQGTALPYTAVAATDTFTTTGSHLLPSDGIGVVVKGTVPAGTVAGRVYYSRDRTATTYKLGASRVLGTGTLTSGSNQLTDLAAVFNSGTWAVGHSVSGSGVPTGTTITALAGGTATMSANATATTSTGGAGLIGVSTAVNLTSAGSGTAYHEVLSLNKLYMDDVVINGNLVANLNGLACSLQQQSELWKLRIDACPGRGLVLGGQQAVFIDFESVFCGTAIHLEGASYMNFYAPDLEGCNKAIYVSPAATTFTVSGARVCSFIGTHIEMNSGSGYVTNSSVAVDIEGEATEMVFDTMTVSMNAIGQKVFHVHTGTTLWSGYDIRSAHCNTGGPAAHPVFMQDDDRGHAVDTWEDVNVHVGELKATPQPSSTNYHDRGAHAVMLPAGGYIRFGPQNPTDPKLAMRAGSDQTGHQAVWRNTSDVDKTWVAADGSLTTGALKITGGAGTARVLTSDADGDATWQALPSGSDVLALPSFESGQYAFCGMGIPTNPGADVTGRVIFTPILWALDREREIDRMGVLVASGGGAGSVCRFGLYADDGNMQPGALITDFGTVSTAANGFAEVTVSEVLLPGMYWAAIVAQVAAPQWERLVPITWGMLQSNVGEPGIGTYAQTPVPGGLTDPALLTYPGSLRLSAPAVMVRMV